MLTVGDRNDAMDETTPETWLALSSALGLGLLIGLVRERRPGRAHAIAGLRTHALVALAAAVAMSLGVPVLLVALALTGLLAAMDWAAAHAPSFGWVVTAPCDSPGAMNRPFQALNKTTMWQPRQPIRAACTT